MIQTVKKMINTPLIIGGGIRSGKEAKEKLDAGADLIVVGNVLEKDESLLQEIMAAVK